MHGMLMRAYTSVSTSEMPMPHDIRLDEARQPYSYRVESTHVGNSKRTWRSLSENRPKSTTGHHSYIGMYNVLCICINCKTDENVGSMHVLAKLLQVPNSTYATFIPKLMPMLAYARMYLYRYLYVYLYHIPYHRYQHSYGRSTSSMGSLSHPHGNTIVTMPKTELRVVWAYAHIYNKLNNKKKKHPYNMYIPCTHIHTSKERKLSNETTVHLMREDQWQ